jgi:hypothetical protein
MLISDCGLMPSYEGLGFEAGRKPECLGKQKRFQNMISLSTIGKMRTTRCRFRRAKDECGTMKEELKMMNERLRRKRDEEVRGRQEGAGQVWNESRNVSENKRDASI